MHFQQLRNRFGAFRLDWSIGLLLTVSIAATAAGCGGGGNTKPPTAPVLPTAPTPSDPVARTIAVGEVVSATITGNHGCPDADVEAPCDVYRIVAPGTGTLTVRMEWDNPQHFLGFELIAHNKDGLAHGGATGHGGPIVGRVGVDGGSTVDVEVWFGGDQLPAPSIQKYQLTSELASSGLAKGLLNGNYLGTFTSGGGNSLQMDALLSQGGDAVTGMWCYSGPGGPFPGFAPGEPFPGDCGWITGTIDSRDLTNGYGKLKAAFAGEDVYGIDATITEADGRTFAGTYDCSWCTPPHPAGTVTFTRK